MAIVSTKHGGLVPCNGGRKHLPGSGQAIHALPWRTVKAIANRFASLNPYRPGTVRDILKVEDYNFDREGNPQQLYGFAVSAKRYVLFTRGGEIIKPSEHGLGPYFHPTKQRYRPSNCQNRKDRYPQWIVTGWRWILRNHTEGSDRSPNWFGIPAVRKIAITTPNVMARLRRVDPESARPYNFVLSPVQIFEGPTLIAPFCEDRSRWTGLENGIEYISVEDGMRYRICKPGEEELLFWTPEFVNAKRRIQYLMTTELRDFAQVFREYRNHPESKSLAPSDTACGEDTRGLLRRRPIQAVGPFGLRGKEVDRRAQDDNNVFSDDKPLNYDEGASGYVTLDPKTIAKLRLEPRRHLRRITGLGQHTIERALRGEPIHQRTRNKLVKVTQTLTAHRNDDKRV
jgi:hypothetical protein